MGSRGARIPPETREAICRDYQAGVKIATIKSTHGVDATTMYRILAEEHIPLRGRRPAARPRAPATRPAAAPDPPSPPSPQPVKLQFSPDEEIQKALAILKDGPIPERPGNFVLTVTSADLNRLTDKAFRAVWFALCLIIKSRISPPRR
jgi:transposase-like protein